MTGSERPASRPRGLFGRRDECEVLGGLLDQARDGHSAVLVVRGEAGAGKTALLDYAVREAADLQVARAVGVESEMELAFAALHQLCGPMLDRLGRLPGTAAGRARHSVWPGSGPPPDRFLIGLAVLSLLSEVAGERPLMCVVDDTQWLDRASAQALAFAARRLRAESVLVLFATREPSPDFCGLPELVVGGLREADARALLEAVVRSPLDRRVKERIVAETRGNPPALLELPRELSPEQLAGGSACRRCSRRRSGSRTASCGARGEGMGLSLTLYTSAVLHNGLGRYRDALDAAERASAYPRELGFANFALVELAARSAPSMAPRVLRSTRDAAGSTQHAPFGQKILVSSQNVAAVPVP